MQSRTGNSGRAFPWREGFENASSVHQLITEGRMRMENQNEKSRRGWKVRHPGGSRRDKKKRRAGETIETGSFDDLCGHSW